MQVNPLAFPLQHYDEGEKQGNQTQLIFGHAVRIAINYADGILKYNMHNDNWDIK